jgi:phage tail-like protein
MTAQASSSERDPFLTYLYWVDIESLDISGGFRTVEGLETTVSSIPYRLSGVGLAHTPRSRPGLVGFGPVTFSKGLIRGSDTFADWIGKLVPYLRAGQFERDPDFRVMISIYLKNHRTTFNNTIMKWDLHEAYPVKYMPVQGLDSMSSEVAIESLVVGYESLEVFKYA